MGDPEDALRAELERIRPIVEEITGLRSRWNGRAELVPNAGYNGKKPFSCDILVDAGLAAEEARWRTLVHEMLHSVSEGYTLSDYLALPGWEEGVVEHLQRLIRPEILMRLGVVVPDGVFEGLEQHHLFNSHMDALESVRRLLGVPPLTFCLQLLRTPICDRPGHVFGMGNRLPDAERTAFVRVYSAANAVLRR